MTSCKIEKKKLRLLLVIYISDKIFYKKTKRLTFESLSNLICQGNYTFRSPIYYIYNSQPRYSYLLFYQHDTHSITLYFMELNSVNHQTILKVLYETIQVSIICLGMPLLPDKSNCLDFKPVFSDKYLSATVTKVAHIGTT